MNGVGWGGVGWGGVVCVVGWDGMGWGGVGWDGVGWGGVGWGGVGSVLKGSKIMLSMKNILKMYFRIILKKKKNRENTLSELLIRMITRGPT